MACNVSVFARKFITLSLPWTTFTLLSVSSMNDTQSVGLCSKDHHHESSMDDIYSTNCVVHTGHAACRSMLQKSTHSWTTITLLPVSSIDDMQRVGLCFKNRHYESFMDDNHSTIHRRHACRSLLENWLLWVVHGRHWIYYLSRPYTGYSVSAFDSRFLTMSYQIYW